MSRGVDDSTQAYSHRPTLNNKSTIHNVLVRHLQVLLITCQIVRKAVPEWCYPSQKFANLS